jgi:hypothetical protein
MKQIYTAVTLSSNPCKHKTGWFHTVYFWIFKRRFLACDDCHELIPQGKWTL